MELKLITTTINEVIAPSVEGYMLLTLLLSFGLEKRFKFEWFKLIMVIEFVLAMAVVYRFQSNKTFTQILLLSLIILVITQINFKGSFYKKIICYGIFVSLLVISEAITFILLSIVGIDGSDIYSSKLYYSYAILVLVVIKLLLLKLVCFKVLKKDKNIKKSYIVRIILLMFFAILACSITVELYCSSVINNNHTIASISFAMFICDIVICLTVLFAFTKLIKETKKQAEQQQILEQYELEHKYSKELNKVLDNLRILKHDLKNHISCMWGLVETDNIDDFKQYLKAISIEIEEISESEIASIIE